jgi:hypothetical protein
MQACERLGGVTGESTIRISVDLGERSPVGATVTQDELGTAYPIVRVTNDPNSAHRRGQNICVPRKTITVLVASS